MPRIDEFGNLVDDAGNIIQPANPIAASLNQGLAVSPPPVVPYMQVSGKGPFVVPPEPTPEELGEEIVFEPDVLPPDRGLLAPDPNELAAPVAGGDLLDENIPTEPTPSDAISGDLAVETRSDVPDVVSGAGPALTPEGLLQPDTVATAQADAAEQQRQQDQAARAANLEAWQPTPMEQAEDLALRQQRRVGEAERELAQLRAQQVKEAKAFSKALEESNRINMMEMQAELRAFRNTKVDPKRLWKNSSTAAKIGGVIGLLAGALVEAGPIGRNNALMFINKAIDDDIRAQEQDLRTKGTALGVQQSLLAINRQNRLDEKSAREMTHVMMQDKILQDLQADFAGRFASEGIQLQFQQLEEQIKADQARRLIEAARADAKFQLEQLEGVAGIRKTEAETVKTLEQAGLTRLQAEKLAREIHGMGGVGAGKQKSPLKDGIVRLEGDKLFATGLTYNGSPVNGLDISSLSDKQKENFRNKMLATQSAWDAIASLLDLGTGRNAIPDKDSARALQQVARVHLNNQQLIKGIPSDRDQQILENFFGLKNPQAVKNWLSSEERRAVLKNFADIVKQDTDSLLDSFQAGLQFTPRGRSLNVKGPNLVQGTPEALSAAGETPAGKQATTAGERRGLRSQRVQELRNAMAEAEDAQLRPGGVPIEGEGVPTGITQTIGPEEQRLALLRQVADKTQRLIGETRDLSRSKITTADPKQLRAELEELRDFQKELAARIKEQERRVEQERAGRYQAEQLKKGQQKALRGGR